jgi:outer membrane protein assembly factor BamB
MKAIVIIVIVVVVVLVVASAIGIVLFEVTVPTISSGTSSFTPSSQTSISSTTSSTGTILSSSTTSNTSPIVTKEKGSSWLTYHNDLARNGYDPNEPQFGQAHFDWQSEKLDGGVYAEPLVADDAVFVATENDSVYALNDRTGAIVWRTNVGVPVPLSSLPCGDIDPLGITGTPVINFSSKTLFAAAFEEPGMHILYAFNMLTGSVIWSRAIDPSGMDVMAQQQRAALTLANGMVYVSYGGLDGDCGDYHGYVVGVSESGNGSMVVYQDPTSREGGIWGTSGPSVDSSGDIYVATGNSEATTNFDFGDAVIRLTPSLQEADYFAPTNWASLNSGDIDLGSVGPSILTNNTIFQIGKEGVGYLLNMRSLGGIGGELFSSQVCDSAFGGNAYAAPYLYVPCTNGIFALNVDSIANNFTTVWSSSSFDAGPPIVTPGAVWTVDIDNATLSALDPLTGTTLFSYQLGSVRHFCTPSAGDGKVYVTSNDSIVAIAIDG